LLIDRRQLRPLMRRGLGLLRWLAARIVIDIEQPVGFHVIRDLRGRADVALIPDHRGERVALVLQ
jgi:hypothetical protein